MSRYSMTRLVHGPGRAVPPVWSTLLNIISTAGVKPDPNPLFQVSTSQDYSPTLATKPQQSHSSKIHTLQCHEHPKSILFFSNSTLVIKKILLTAASLSYPFGFCFFCFVWGLFVIYAITSGVAVVPAGAAPLPR